MNIWDFFTPEAGQKRRRWLEGQAGGLLEYVPPELRPWLAIAEEMNPVTSMERAGSASERMVAPGLSGWDRMAAAGDMLSNVAGVVAPAVAARAAGVPVANAVEEVLTGYSPAAGYFLADESGALRAFHGSPHDFDRFDMSKIGTGEGAQAYGHGLYFAENEAVAQGYRDSLRGQAQPKASGFAANVINGLRSDPALRSATAEDLARTLEIKMNLAPKGARVVVGGVGYERGAVKKALKTLQSGDAGIDGRMYEVQINANPEDFLDWDKPLSEQPAKVRQAMQAQIKAQMPWLDDASIPDMLGEQLYSSVGYKNPAANSSALREAGIPGIRYLDAGSRGAGDGSRNYVVFDDHLISIIRKYGIAGAAALYGVSAADIEAAMAQEQPRGLLNQ